MNGVSVKRIRFTKSVLVSFLRLIYSLVVLVALAGMLLFWSSPQSTITAQAAIEPTTATRIFQTPVNHFGLANYGPQRDPFKYKDLVPETVNQEELNIKETTEPVESGADTPKPEIENAILTATLLNQDGSGYAVIKDINESNEQLIELGELFRNAILVRVDDQQAVLRTGEIEAKLFLPDLNKLQNSLHSSSFSNLSKKTPVKPGDDAVDQIETSTDVFSEFEQPLQPSLNSVSSSNLEFDY